MMKINMRPKNLSFIPFVTLILGLCACQTPNINSDIVKQEARWYNAKGFDGIDSIGTNPYDLEFDISYSGIDGNTIRVRNCLEMSSLGDSKISEREFSRWDLLKTDCEAAKRFYGSPENAVSYWPSTFNFSLLKTFPSTTIPNLGGQGLDGRQGTLGEHEPALSIIKSSENNVKVSYDGMLVNYVVIARGDFNRDGYQDLFVRMDWYIEDAFGDGNDWVILTKILPNSAPMMLWRK